MKDNIYLSVIIPAYNEAQRIRETLIKTCRYLQEMRYRYEVIVVNDGSQDNTSDVIRELSKKMPVIKLLENATNRGKGYAVCTGVRASQGQLVLFSDADLSTPIEELEKLKAALEEGYDIAIGSRGLAGSEIAVRQPWYRETMGKIFNRLVRLFAIRGIKDTQCGFKLFRQTVAKQVFDLQRIERFAFDVELLFIARRRRWRIKEIPIRWINSPCSRVKLGKDSLKMFFDLFKIRMNAMRGRYN